MKKILTKVKWKIVKSSLFPLGILLLFFISYVFYRIKITPLISLQAHQDFKKYIVTIFIICIGFILQRIAGAVLGWYRDNIAAKTITHLDDELIPLLRRTLMVIIWMISLLIILPFYGVNINALIATLGISSLAIALAAQDTIANIIAGFLIMVDRPFRIEDKIKLPSGEVVIVHDIGIRRSKFLSEDKAIIIVPNLELSKSKIVNYTYGKERLNKIEGGSEG